MKQMQKKDQSYNKGVLSKQSDNPRQNQKAEASTKKKGILSKINDNPDQKK